MAMNYNKWGVVTGIVGLVLLLISPISYIIAVKFKSFFGEFATIIFFGIFFNLSFSFIFGIAALSLGILSIKKGENKKAALILGTVCILLSLLLIIYVIRPWNDTHQIIIRQIINL